MGPKLDVRVCLPRSSAIAAATFRSLRDGFAEFFSYPRAMQRFDYISLNKQDLQFDNSHLQRTIDSLLNSEIVIVLFCDPDWQNYDSKIIVSSSRERYFLTLAVDSSMTNTHTLSEMVYSLLSSDNGSEFIYVVIGEELRDFSVGDDMESLRNFIYHNEAGTYLIINKSRFFGLSYEPFTIESESGRILLLRSSS
jgi:hypothetical protein